MIELWIILTIMTFVALGFVLKPLFANNADQSGVKGTSKNSDQQVTVRQKSTKKQSLYVINEHFEKIFNKASTAEWIFRGALKVSPKFEKGALILSIVLPALALTLYLFLGSSPTLKNFRWVQNQVAVVKADMRRFGNLNKLTLKLEQHMKQHPNSSRGWFLLGRLYLAEHHYQKAVLVLKRADKLQPNNLETSKALSYALNAGFPLSRE